MDTIKKSEGYGTGTEMWRQILIKYGFDEAVIICNSYLDMNLHIEHSDEERHFCRELFTAMYEATAGKPSLYKIVYPYPFEKARDRFETSYYHKNRRLNGECVQDIDEAIQDCCYELNYYNLECAAWKVLLKYGFSRVSATLMNHIKRHKYDGRYARTNKEWGQEFALSEKAFDGAYFKSHATLIDSFTNYVRKLYTGLDAERFALPGNAEYGESIQGYNIIRSFKFNSDKGVVIGHSATAPDKYVCWVMTVTDSERYYDWGLYGAEKDAVDGYHARIFVHLSADN